MYFTSSTLQVYLALGSTDMRKSINGLSLLVQEHLEMNPLSGHLFVFCNRARTLIKVLYWDRNGFCLWQKRLEDQHFIWPERMQEVMEIDQRQLGWLLEGLDICRMRAHKVLSYSILA